MMMAASINWLARAAECPVFKIMITPMLAQIYYYCLELIRRGTLLFKSGRYTLSYPRGHTVEVIAAACHARFRSLTPTLSIFKVTVLRHREIAC